MRNQKSEQAFKDAMWAVLFFLIAFALAAVP